jgi:membrane-associated protein
MFETLLSWFLHLDKHLYEVIVALGPGVYAFLFAIVFCETGLVVTPFLPGDSLLFAAGTLIGTGALHPVATVACLFIAAVAGDAVNYSIGSVLGPRALQKYPKVFKPEYLEKTKSFYDRYGSKTIVLARFVPIVRTFAPFLAGVGKMPYAKFGTFNFVGATLWVGLCVAAGYLFGSMEWVQKNFSVVVLGIVFVSVLPMVFEWLRHRREERV